MTLLKHLARKGLVGSLGRRVTKDHILGAIGRSGKSGAVGGIIDGVLGAAEALKLREMDLIDNKTAAKHALNEGACGLFTSTAGTLGTTVASLVLGAMGPTSLVVGMGASVGARWLYRRNIASPLPDFEEEPVLDETTGQDLEHLLSVINAEDEKKTEGDEEA